MKISEIIFNSVIHTDYSSKSERDFQENIRRGLINEGYQDYRKYYTQKFRVKNLGTSKPDIIIKAPDGTLSIIEIKLVPDKKRGANRFQRAFVDVAYLKGEIKDNGTDGFLVLIDQSGEEYFQKNGFAFVCENLLDIRCSVAHSCCNESMQLIVFKITTDKLQIL